MTSPFDYVKSITTTKEDMLSNPENDPQQYVPYIVNKSLSSFPDCLFFANEMNRYNSLDKDMQYHYYLNSIRKSKRFAKWLKRVDEENLDLVKKYFGYNNIKAKQALRILTTEQLEEIKNKMVTGGKK